MFTEITLSRPDGALASVAAAAHSEPSLQGLFSRQVVETFEPGAAVFWEGDVASHVFAVAEGVLRVFKILSDGRRVITGFLYPGDLLGISFRDHYLYTAEAVTTAKLRRFSRTRFRDEIDQSPELRPQLFARLCDEMAAAQEQLVLLARKTAEERVSSFLLVIARRLSGNPPLHPVVDIPMTRLDMADYLGLTIETVSRTMTKLASCGVITPSGRHAVRVRNLEKLALLAGECDIDGEFAGGTMSVRQAVWPQ